MNNKLCYMVDIIENNESCVVLQVKDNKKIDLIKLGCFDGDEELIRLTKGKKHTCTIFYKENKNPFSWYWGRGGCTLVSDKVSKMGDLIEDCITDDFDIYIGEDDSKIKESLHIKSLDDAKNSKHSIEIMYFKNDDHVIVHKDDEFYKAFSDVDNAIKFFKDLDYDVNYLNKYVAGTGCIVEEYSIKRNMELLNCTEESITDDEMEI